MLREHTGMSAILGVNVGLSGINGVVSEFVKSISPILQTTLLLLQVLVAGFTAWFIYKKIRQLQVKEAGKVEPRGKVRKQDRRSRRRRGRAAAAGILLAFSVIYLFSGCGVMQTHVKPGHIRTATGIEQVQPFDPKSGTSLKSESETGLEFVMPAGSEVTTTDPRSGKKVVFKVSTDTPVKSFTKEKVDSGLGAADLSIGKLIAKLQSVRWIQGVGILIFLFGAATFVYPPLRVVIGSVTTSIIISIAGLGLVILPILVVGHEVLILAVCGGTALGYIFLTRYGKKSGEVSVLSKVVDRMWVDRNGDGKVQPDELVPVAKKDAEAT